MHPAREGSSMNVNVNEQSADRLTPPALERRGLLNAHRQPGGALALGPT